MKKKVLIYMAVLAILVCSIVYKTTMVQPNIEEAIGLIEEDGLKFVMVDRNGDAINVSIHLQSPITRETFIQNLTRIIEAAESTYGDKHFPTLTVFLDGEKNATIMFRSTSKTTGEISTSYNASTDDDAPNFKNIVHADVDAFSDFLSQYADPTLSISYELPAGMLLYKNSDKYIGIVTDYRRPEPSRMGFDSWEEFDNTSWEFDASEEFIQAVIEAIDGQFGEGEKVLGVEMDGSNLIIAIDISGTISPSNIPLNLVAESRAARITDKVLQLDQDDRWETITIDFGSVGWMKCGKADIQSNEYGRYIDPIKIQ